MKAKTLSELHFRLKLEARFKFEHKIKDMSPEDQKREKAKLEKINNERKMKHKKVAAPMSETQEKEVWEKDDNMESVDFSLLKYFNLHDVDASGKWNKQELQIILFSLSNLSFLGDSKSDATA